MFVTRYSFYLFHLLSSNVARKMLNVYYLEYSNISFFCSHDHSHRYHDSHRDRSSHHSSDYSRTHDRSADHTRSHDQHSRSSYERSSDHHSRSYEKGRDRRDDHHRSSARDYLPENRYHSHRDRNTDSTSRHGNSTSSPKSGVANDSKRHGEEKRGLETDREKR